jgi:hypothetical protein
MTRAEAILLGAVEDAEAVLGIIESFLRKSGDAPTAEVLRLYKNRANATLQIARAVIKSEEEKPK